MVEIQDVAAPNEDATSSDADLLEALNALEITDISQNAPRRVVFYSSDFDESTFDLTDDSVCYVDLANSPIEAAALNASGGESDSSFSIVDGSTTLNELQGFAGSGGTDLSYFVFQTPEIPAGSYGYVKFTGSATAGNDYRVYDGSVPGLGNGYGQASADGSFIMAVSGGSSYCVVPINDSTVEPTETIKMTMEVVQLSGGGTTSSEQPLYAKILDSDARYTYTTETEISNLLQEIPPTEQDSEEYEWTDFLSYYRRDNPSSNDCLSLNQTGLDDDYRRALNDPSGASYEAWVGMKESFRAAVSQGLVNGDAFVASNYNVARDVTNVDDLYVYGNGYTGVAAKANASLISKTVETDSLGVVQSTERYSVSVSFECSVNDEFRDILDTDEKFGFEFELGTPYHLTGAWCEVETFVITVTRTRVLMV